MTSAARADRPGQHAAEWLVAAKANLACEVERSGRSHIVDDLEAALKQFRLIAEGEALAVEGPADEHPSPPTPAKGPVAAAEVEPKKAAAKVKAAKPAKAASGKETDPLALEKVIAHLRDHAKGRPTKRDALERHVATILGGKVAPDSVCSLVAGLERAGIVDISDKQVTYKLPKAKK